MGIRSSAVAADTNFYPGIHKNTKVQTFRQLEILAAYTYKKCEKPSSKIEAICQICKTLPGLYAFINFLNQSNLAAEGFSSRETFRGINLLLNHVNYLEFVGNFEALRGSDYEEEEGELEFLFNFLARSAFLKLAMDSLPKFVDSKFYKKWRLDEMKCMKELTVQEKAVVCTTVPDIISDNENHRKYRSASAFVPAKNNRSFIHFNIDARDLFPTVKDTRENVVSAECTSVLLATTQCDGIGSETAAEIAIGSIDKFELPALIKLNPWLFHFISVAESLPVSICISTASNERPGFPLIYVNNYFELQTGYKREEVIGGSARFLQKNSTGQQACEVEAIERMSYALHYEAPAMVRVTNYRKDGSSFLNFVGLKPVFDRSCVYKYVICVSLDITRESTLMNAKLYLDNIFEYIPSALSPME